MLTFELQVEGHAVHPDVMMDVPRLQMNVETSGAVYTNWTAAHVNCQWSIN